MQAWKTDTDTEKRHVDTVGEGKGRLDWESRIDMYTLLC